MLKVLTARRTVLCWRLRKTKLCRVSLSRQIKWLIFAAHPVEKRIPSLYCPVSCSNVEKFVAFLQACREILLSFFPLISTPKSEKKDKYKLAGAACAHMIGSRLFFQQRRERCKWHSLKSGKERFRTPVCFQRLCNLSLGRL